MRIKVRTPERVRFFHLKSFYDESNSVLKKSKISLMMKHFNARVVAILETGLLPHQRKNDIVQWVQNSTNIVFIRLFKDKK
ncbi:hypothetical protein HNQ69_000486 [Bartonella callosciuri]|uniref:Uncharacterized protein n=1 Tax=Bartonella callosciuri TaxID=686223 RepID=A0A840NTT5_9HYPH|nr:hypothetical protein [Bartonella callosciuri]